MIYAVQASYGETVSDRSISERIGVVLSIEAVIGQPSGLPDDRLVPISEAARRLGRSVWTLKRLHKRRCLPAIIDTQWLVPESFIDMVFASMRPGCAVDFAAVAADWFAARGAIELVVPPEVPGDSSLCAAVTASAASAAPGQ